MRLCQPSLRTIGIVSALQQYQMPLKTLHVRGSALMMPGTLRNFWSNGAAPAAEISPEG